MINFKHVLLISNFWAIATQKHSYLPNFKIDAQINALSLWLKVTMNAKVSL